MIVCYEDVQEYVARMEDWRTWGDTYIEDACGGSPSHTLFLHMCCILLRLADVWHIDGTLTRCSRHLFHYLYVASGHQGLQAVTFKQKKLQR